MILRAEGILPYEKPWVLIDKVIDYSINQEIATLKQISSSDYFLPGHFPAYSVYPGMLLVEGIKQSAELLAHFSGIQAFVAGSSIQQAEVNARFLQPVEPGDSLIYIVRLLVSDSEQIVFEGAGSVHDTAVIRAKIKLKLGQRVV
jgi:3-hydroxyacyl-[acyl-carrier-protein] dehydratase